ncbi:unnamed protein product, partial [Symbiodinium sp. KB8]
STQQAPEAGDAPAPSTPGGTRGSPRRGRGGGASGTPLSSTSPPPAKWNASTNPSSVAKRKAASAAAAAAAQGEDSAKAEEERRAAARRAAQAVAAQVQRAEAAKQRREAARQPASAQVWADAAVPGFSPVAAPSDGRSVGRVRDTSGGQAPRPLHEGEEVDPHSHWSPRYAASLRGETSGAPSSPRRLPRGVVASEAGSEWELDGGGSGRVPPPSASMQGGSPSGLGEREWNPYFHTRGPGAVNKSTRFQYDKALHEPDPTPEMGPTLASKVSGTHMEAYILDAKAARKGSPGSTLSSVAGYLPDNLGEAPASATSMVSDERSVPLLQPAPGAGSMASSGGSLLEQLASGSIPPGLLGGEDSDEEASEGAASAQPPTEGSPDASRAGEGGLTPPQGEQAQWPPPPRKGPHPAAPVAAPA